MVKTLRKILSKLIKEVLVQVLVQHFRTPGQSSLVGIVAMGSSNDQLSRWLEGRLNEVLGFQSSEIVNYILSLDNDSDRHSYLVEMLDPSRYAQCSVLTNFLPKFLS